MRDLTVDEKQIEGTLSDYLTKYPHSLCVSRDWTLKQLIEMFKILAGTPNATDEEIVNFTLYHYGGTTVDSLIECVYNWSYGTLKED